MICYRFFDHYLAMTAPLLRSSELERITLGSSPGETVSRAARVTGRFVGQVHGCADSFGVSLVTALELAGATFELFRSGLLSNGQASHAQRVLEAFDELFVDQDELGFATLARHLTAYSATNFKQWARYSRIAHKEEPGLVEFFDQDQGVDVDLLELDDIQEFIAKARTSGRYQAIVLYFDHINFLFAREQLSRAMPLAKSLEIDTRLDRDIRKTDERIRGISEAADFMLRAEVRKWYQPTDFYWWYYSMPRTLKIEYG